jgi:hypothetical protein
VREENFKKRRGEENDRGWGRKIAKKKGVRRRIEGGWGRKFCKQRRGEENEEIEGGGGEW